MANVEQSDPGKSIYLDPPRDYFNYAVLLTILCCVPLGLVALYYSAMSRVAIRDGNIAEASRVSSKARLWVRITFTVGVCWWGLFTVALVMLGGLSR